MRIAEQLALPLAGRCLPLPVAPRLVRRAVRRLLKRLPRAAQVPVKSAEVWAMRGFLEQQALLEQVRDRARCRARNVTGRNSARGCAAYVATSEGSRVERALRQLREQVQAKGRMLG